MIVAVLQTLCNTHRVSEKYTVTIHTIPKEKSTADNIDTQHGSLAEIHF